MSTYFFRHKSGLIFFIAVIIILSIATFQRNIVWVNELVFWQDVEKKSSMKPRGYNNLGLNYARIGRLDEAIGKFKTALKLNPSFADAHNNLGNAYAVSGRLNEAIEAYQNHIRLNPNHLDTHYNLGVLYKSMGLRNEAKKEFEIALQLNPNDTSARQALESLGR